MGRSRLQADGSSYPKEDFPEELGMSLEAAGLCGTPSHTDLRYQLSLLALCAASGRKKQAVSFSVRLFFRCRIFVSWHHGVLTVLPQANSLGSFLAFFLPLAYIGMPGTEAVHALQSPKKRERADVAFRDSSSPGKDGAETILWLSLLFLICDLYQKPPECPSRHLWCLN